jgi:hypothetical protein
VDDEIAGQLRPIGAVHKDVHSGVQAASTATPHAVNTSSPSASTGTFVEALTVCVAMPNVVRDEAPGEPEGRSQGEGE